jgi:serine/threonine protein kinase
MATGALPFRGETSGVIFDAILNRVPLAPVRLNPKLEDVINRALEKDRELRYQHAVDIKSELLRLKRDLESGRNTAVSAAVISPDAAHTVASPEELPEVLPAAAQQSSGSARVAAVGASRASSSANAGAAQTADPSRAWVKGRNNA